MPNFWQTDLHQQNLKKKSFEYVDSWSKNLLFRTHHLWNFNTELILTCIEIANLTSKFLCNFLLLVDLMTRFWPILLTGFCYSWYSGYVPIFQLCSCDKLIYDRMIKLVLKIYCIRKVIIVVNEESDMPGRYKVWKFFKYLIGICIIRSLEINFQFFKIPMNLFFIRFYLLLRKNK